MGRGQLASFSIAVLCAGACSDGSPPTAADDPGSQRHVDGGAHDDAKSPEGNGDRAPPPPPTGKFRIGVWCGIPDSELSKERFDELAEAGVTTVSFPCSGPLDDPAYNKRMLPFAQAAGLDAIIMDVRIEAAVLGVEVEANLDRVAADYAKEPALSGYHVVDEPGAAAFPRLADIVTGLAARDAKRFTSINLFPHYAGAGLGVPTYEAYVEQFLSTVKPKIFSFDFYPFLQGGADDASFFVDLEIVRERALATNTPFWQFVQSISFGNRRKTNGPEKLWVGTQTLAYGGAGISYFTYFTPPQTSENFGDGIIDAQGKRTPQYDEIKANDRRLAAWGRYLVAARSTAVFHNGALPPRTVPRVPSMPVYVPSAAPVTVGLFDSPVGVYAFIANRDYANTVDTDVYLAPTEAPPEILDVAAGTFAPLTVLKKDATGTRVHVSLAPADGALVLMRGAVPKGPPGAEAFIGTVRADAGSLDVVDQSFGAARMRTASWNECPAGYDLAGTELEPNGFWLCVRQDLAARTFLVGNVVDDTGTLYAVGGGKVMSQGLSSWDACPNAKLVGRRFERNGFWVCLE